jgi:hypothetical protein
MLPQEFFPYMKNFLICSHPEGVSLSAANLVIFPGAPPK